jgi:hypothetical protein
LAVEVFSSEAVAALQAELSEQVARVGGRLDGMIEQGLAFTVPVVVGFASLEAVFNKWVAEHPGWELYFADRHVAVGFPPKVLTPCYPSEQPR